MQTNFTLAQLADPDIAEANEILRACVHCGFCTATCPTYVLLGDELDSPRGRIYLIKDMLERDRPAPARLVTHVDRCLSCLSCMTTCPSGVNYMHLVDLARIRIEETHRRPVLDRALRALLAWMVPHPKRFRLALAGAWFAKPLAKLLPGRLGAMLALAPRALASGSAVDRPQVFAAQGARRARVALLSGCAQQVLAPAINEATVRLLTRHGVEVVVAEGMGCCGALTHHMGREVEALASVKANVAAWSREAEAAGLDAIVINASGCGTTVKEYGFMLRNDGAWAERAAKVSALTQDASEFLTGLGLGAPLRETGLTVAYQSACPCSTAKRSPPSPRRC
jgi:glycolate oxidase iron-sulfur subunit